MEKKVNYKVCYTRNTSIGPEYILLDSEAEAWDMAFTDLRLSRAFPEDIASEKNAWNRQEIFRRWQERNTAAVQSPPEDSMTNIPESVSASAKTGPPALPPASQEFAQYYEHLPEGERKVLARCVVKKLPPFLQSYYKRQIVYGPKTLMECPTIYPLFCEIGASLTNKKEV